MQPALFGHHVDPGVDPSFVRLQRRPLDAGAWVDYVPGWLDGHARAFDALLKGLCWRETTQVLFDEVVATPRRIASFPEDGVPPEWLTVAGQLLSQRYGVHLDRRTASLYRDGQDSVAWHRDRGHRERARAIVAIVSVGEPRKLLLRPWRRSSSDPERPRGSMAFSLGWGDLLVMGGTCQRTWEHAVPKVRRAGPRISLMFRHDPDAYVSILSGKSSDPGSSAPLGGRTDQDVVYGQVRR